MDQNKDNVDKYKVIENLYLDTREWLKFSEAKNAALLALTSATFFGFMRIIFTNDSLNKCLIVLVFILLIITILVNLCSFFPRKVEGNKKQKNLLFYENLQDLSPKELYKIFNDDYFLINTANDEKESYLLDLYKQIHALANITAKKNVNFKIGIILIVLSYIFILINVIMSLS